MRSRVLARPLRNPDDDLHSGQPGHLHRHHHLRQPARAGQLRGGQADPAAHQFFHRLASRH